MEHTKSFASFMRSPYKSRKHSTYFYSYDYFFEKYIGKQITFVEIGVLGGGSLFMWRDFFGPNARIIGVDLNPNAKKWETHGFEIYIGNQSDPNFWSKFCSEVGNLDVVLDDGGHTYEQQIITVECLLPHINDNGILLVEDTHTSYLDGFGPRKFSFIRYVKNKIDDVNKRFSKLDKNSPRNPSEKRFWSIEITESMVAFKIKRSACNTNSYQITNGGHDDNAVDFKYNDNIIIEMYSRYMDHVLPKFVSRQIIKKIANRKSSELKKFFK